MIFSYSCPSPDTGNSNHFALNSQFTNHLGYYSACENSHIMSPLALGDLIISALA